MAIDRTMIDAMLDGFDVKNRRIYFGNVIESHDSDGSDFTWRSVELAIRQIHMFENDNPHKPIELHMDSPGGSAYNMLRLVDAIEASPCQFKFYGGGMIMSSATWVMAVCDERYLYRHCRVLLHDGPSYGSAEVPVKLTDRRIDMVEEDDLQDKLNKIYADNSRMPVEFYATIVKRDCFLSAEETIALGLADKILEPKKRGNLRRMRLALLNKDVDKKELTKVVNKIYSRVGETRIPAKIEIHLPGDKSDSKVFVEKEKPVEQEAQPAVVVEAPKESTDEVAVALTTAQS